MLADLRRLAERIIDGTLNGGDGASTESAKTGAKQEQRSVMIVESDTEMQNTLREGLRKVGYRVLVLSDPQRAFERLTENPDLASCVVLLAQQLGESALNAFNQLGEDPVTSPIPAMLLLEQTQRSWKSRAATGNHRMVLSMPITMKQLRSALNKLTEDTSNSPV